MSRKFSSGIAPGGVLRYYYLFIYIQPKKNRDGDKAASVNV